MEGKIMNIMETKRFIYSMQGANDAGGWVPIEGMTGAYRPAIKLPHPQTNMRELGFNHVRSECFSIPCVWLFECTSWPETLPPYIREEPTAKFTEE
jgi:hypothetical protein